MSVLEKIGNFFGKFMAIIVLVVAALSLFAPSTTIWVQTKWINYLLMIVMFGMGLTLRLEDFKLVFTRPKDIIIGCLAQFLIMPLLAFALGKIFSLEVGLLAGVILVGTCPGGTSSNVITYLSKGDVALSVGMTSVNTLLAPLLTPAITYLLLKTSVTVDVVSMFLSIIKVVIVPIALGFIINKFFGKYTQKIIAILPAVSVIAICLIVAAVVSHNAQKILSTGAIVFAVVILHNLLGYGCGFLLGKALRLSVPKTKALSVEIGMQNSGLATSLAGTAFPNLAMATVPGAIFSVWHNISGAILANIYLRWQEPSEENTSEANTTTETNAPSEEN
ncbi:MAG: bile acid:sodium symporter family protein [Treponema sp.]|nr:bile acid:sodium symporter family protein [Treponema sp.]